MDLHDSPLLSREAHLSLRWTGVQEVVVLMEMWVAGPPASSPGPGKDSGRVYVWWNV